MVDVVIVFDNVIHLNKGNYMDKQYHSIANDFNGANFLLAPNGNPSNLTPEQYKLVRTPQFKKWFGDWERLAFSKVKDPAMDEVTLENLSKDVSKVVDENGEPLVVYHTSNDDFYIFDKKKSKGGFYFSANKDRLDVYGKSKLNQYFLDIKSPTNDEFNLIGFDGVMDFGYMKIKNPKFLYEIIAFKNNQIKLADGSNTTFDGSNPDIRFDGGGEVEKLNPILSLWSKFSNGYIADYLNIGESDYVMNDEDNVFVIFRDEKYGDFSKVEKEYIKRWFSIYKIDDYSIDGNKILIQLGSNPDIRFDGGGNIFKNGGNMKKVDSGGITYGESHDNGGIPVKNASTGEMLEVEGGEGIVNKRSMASEKMVKLNGKEMSICEAVSKLNQMEGGVKFSCDDVEHSQFIEEMALGGELERGTRTEKEHIQVLNDLYANRITPKQATEKIAKDHIKENPNYYTELAKIEKKMANGGKSDCGCSHHTRTKFSQGGEMPCGCSGHNDLSSAKKFAGGGFVRGKGTIEDLLRSKSKQNDKIGEIVTDTISEARNLLDVDYLPIIKANNFAFYNKYLVGFQHLNLYKMGWRFQFGTSRQWAGLCDSRDRVEVSRANLSKNKNLYVSINFVKHDANWSKNSKDVILHEIAHALVTEIFEKKLSKEQLSSLDPKHFLLKGHGELWREVCKSINQDGSCSQFYVNAMLQETFKTYMYDCAICRTKKYSNSSTFTKNCFKCGSPVIVVKSKI